MNLARKQLILKVTGEVSLDYNYNYELMKRLYEAITVEDKAKAKLLHAEGFKVDNKKFKLFNYSLLIENAVYKETGISFNQDNIIKLILSGKKEIVNSIILGLVKLQYFTLNNIKFQVFNFEDDVKFRFNKIMLYKVRTPVVESVFEKENKVMYLNPAQQEFYKALGQNLLRKYEIIYGKKYEGELYFDIENMLNAKKKYVTKIKENGYIIGYTNFEIFIQADIDMQKVAYYCGLGQNNSIGMGLVTFITGRRA